MPKRPAVRRAKRAAKPSVEAALLTHDELDALSALADALNAIAGSNLPAMADRLAGEVLRLRRLIEDGEDKGAMHELAEGLNSIGIYQWAEALGRGDRVIEKVVLALVPKDDEGEDPSDR